MVHRTKKSHLIMHFGVLVPMHDSGLCGLFYYTDESLVRNFWPHPSRLLPTWLIKFQGSECASISLAERCQSSWIHSLLNDAVDMDVRTTK